MFLLKKQAYIYAYNHNMINNDITMWLITMNAEYDKYISLIIFFL